MRAESNDHTGKTSSSSAFTPKDTDRVHTLCHSLFDDVISDTELNELNQLLSQHPNARRLYLRYALLVSTLQGNVSKNQDLLSVQLANHVDTFDSAFADDAVTPMTIPAQHETSAASHATNVLQGRRWESTIAWAAAASLLLAATAFWWNGNLSFKPEQRQEQIVSTSVPSQNTPTSKTTKQPASTIKITYTSSASVLTESSDLPNATAFVETESLLQLGTGEVELTYPSGTKLLLIGPAEFMVNNHGGKLIRGGLVASVTEAGHGFTIDLPNGKVVDLGTEFGVTVDDFGVSGVSVFKGNVEAFPLTDGQSTGKMKLNKGDGLQWDNSAVVSLKADLRKFASSLSGRHLSDKDLQKRTCITDLFRESTLDDEKWTTLGDVEVSDGDLLLRGQKDLWARPYLISRQQFDPLSGPVTVTCDVRFDQSASIESPEFSILTRSDSERGTTEHKPSAGTLSSCVRCSFGTDDSKQGGLISAGVKLESVTKTDRLILDSYNQPQADTRYRFIMRDDGVHVTFTVSLLDQPTVSKTVTCRSLFRAKQNHIAFEGALTGSTIIERIEISQDRSAAMISSYEEFSSLLQNTPQQRAIEQRVLRSWIPTDAKLLISDDFNAEQLDSRMWRTIGQLPLINGSIQLGVHNQDQHIDTWHSRPHLLTRDRISTTDGALTITGKVTFAENFLAGFGGSFAVVTRADDRLGSGPGWENSILQRGVRANFWPAAWDTKHNLEIFQKPSANTITLLGTQGVQVDPFARIYLFRAVDDGNQVALTLLDPRKPDQPIEIRSPTTIPMQTGHIAFESCWGSPVLLDDVTIYQSKSPIREP